MGQKEENRVNSKRKKSRLHFSPADATERGSLVKALRCASPAGAAPQTSGLDKAPFRAPVFALLMGKMKKKNFVRSSVFFV
jgi:hypothetical protein